MQQSSDKRQLEEPPNSDPKNDNKKLKTTTELDKNLVDQSSPVVDCFSKLPHELLLLIFKNLSIHEICPLARVCKKWRRAAYDETLWYHIDLSDYSVNIRKLWKLFRHRCFPNAKSISICGNLKSAHVLSKTQQSVSKALMEKLNAATGGNLRVLELRYSDLSSIEVNDLPDELLELKLTRCEIPLKWFENNKRLNGLVKLDLSESSRICASHIKDLAKNTHSTLETLCLRNCYRIDDKAIDLLADEKFTRLVHLDLEGTKITQYGLQIICTRLNTASLAHLNLKNCKCLNLNKENLDFVRSAFGNVNSFKLVY